MAINKLLVIDTETGGLDPANTSILSLAGVVMKDNAIVDSIELFIAEPEFKVEKKAMEVNGIDLNWLRKNGYAPKDAASKFAMFLLNHFGSLRYENKIVLVGQNVGFDIGYLKRLFAMATLNTYYNARFSHRNIDTAGILRFLGLAQFLPFDGGSLDDAVAHYKIDTAKDKRHSALGDALTTAKVLATLTTDVAAAKRAMQLSLAQGR